MGIDSRSKKKIIWFVIPLVLLTHGLTYLPTVVTNGDNQLMWCQAVVGTRLLSKGPDELHTSHDRFCSIHAIFT